MSYSSSITLFKNVPLSKTQNIQINFPEQSKTQQLAYFNTFSKTEKTALRWIKPQECNIEISFETALGYNYASYVNNSGKRFYLFIDNIEYVNDNTTRFYFSIDYFQTYLFDHTIGESFIEREHQSRLVKSGANYYPIFNTKIENIDVGAEMVEKLNTPLTQVDVDNVTKIFKEPMLIISTKPLFYDTKASGNNFYAKDHKTPYFIYLDFNTSYPSPIHYKIWSQSDNSGATVTEQILDSDALKQFSYSDIENNADSIVAIIPVKRMLGNVSGSGTPSSPYLLNNYTNNNADYVAIRTASGSSEYRILIRSLNVNANAFLGYIPINSVDGTITSLSKDAAHNIINESKLLTSQFTKINFITNYGNILELKREMLSFTGNRIISLNYGFTPSIDYREWVYCPQNLIANHDLIDSDDRTLPLASDEYINYLNQNKSSRLAGMLVPVGLAAAGVAGAAFTGGASLALTAAAAGAISVGASVASKVAKEQDLKSLPLSVKSSKGSVQMEIQRGEFEYKLQVLSITDEYKTRLYNYLRLYGYRCGEIKTPNINSRYWYNYIQTVGVNVLPSGDINATAISELENIYNNGILIKHIRANMNSTDYLTTTKENVEMELITT